MMNNENGRSMVEMLGVLAIIGVLSVAGIAGYSMAMKKYKANEIIATASTFYMLAEAGNLSGNLAGSAYIEGGDNTIGLADVSLSKPFGTVDMTYDYNTGKIFITGAGDLCTTITSTFGNGPGGFTISCS